MFRRHLALVSVFMVVAAGTAQQPAGLDRDLAGLPSSRRAVVSTIVQRLAELGSDLRVVALIPELENRYGAFADLDRDGDLDYVATEMRHGQEEVRIHIAGARTWRRGTQRGTSFSQKHPLGAWIIADDGSGKPAVVLPVGWPPYLYVLRTDGRSRFIGSPEPLGEHLPARISRPGGVDNCPYEITECIAATDEVGARIVGVMHDEVGERSLALAWEIELGAEPAGTSRALPAPPDFGALPDSIQPVPSPARCEHESAERRAVVSTRARDLTGDGVDDLVVFSGVFSGHVFPGVSEAGQLTFPRELGRARDVPIEDLRFWFPTRFDPDSPTVSYAFRSIATLRKIGFRIESVDDVDAAFTLITTRRKGWLLDYYWAGDALVPVQNYRTFWPGTERGHSFSDRHREVLLFDANHDRSVDLLSVHVGKEYVWLKTPPADGGFLPPGSTRETNPGKLRAGLVHSLGDRGDEGNRTLAVFPGFVELPEDPHAGNPITLEWVPVFEGGKLARQRICVLFRPWQLGVFFEVAAPPEAVERNARVYAARMARANARLAMREYYWDCDVRQCAVSETPHLEVYEDAAAFFLQALELAASAEQKAAAHHALARCRSMSGDIARARHHYERFVISARRLDPLDAHPPELGRLFADAEFRKLHARWREALE